MTDTARVDDELQIRALLASAGRSVSQHSQLGRSCSMGRIPVTGLFAVIAVADAR